MEIVEFLQKLSKIDELERRINELTKSEPSYIPLRSYLQKYNLGLVTVWKLRKQGLIQSKKIGRKVYVLDKFPETK